MTVSFSAKFHSFNKWSRIFDSGNGPNDNNFLIANPDTTNDFTAEIFIGNSNVFKFFTNNPCNNF